MTEEASGPSAALVRALALALEAGTQAESAIHPITVPAAAPNGLLGLAVRWQRRALTAPSGDQIRRACEHLDEFAQTLADLANHIDDDAFAEVSSQATGWSDVLWEKGQQAAALYNEVRATVATLARYRDQPGSWAADHALRHLTAAPGTGAPRSRSPVQDPQSFFADHLEVAAESTIALSPARTRAAES